MDYCDTCQGTYLDSGELERLRALQTGARPQGDVTPEETMEAPTSPSLAMWALFMGGTYA